MKKPNVPPPPRPRRQAGPKRRDTREPAQWRKRASIATAAAVVLAAAIAAILVVRSGSGGEKALVGRLAATGCPLKTYPEQAPRHVGDYGVKVTYNSSLPRVAHIISSRLSGGVTRNRS